ncbi:uncharacterized protein LOC114130114 [Aphis gossypii]|uniref:uncharacterized protein LOC114130114 n=1 Tax=Aphis gossypii TaxID=80765 RepID=UPI0021597349|nr:uncharacterized protein LOC114130114 [Aphis gossypii]
MDVVDPIIVVEPIIKKNPKGKPIGIDKKKQIIYLYEDLLQKQNENPDSPRLTYRQRLFKLSILLGIGQVTIQRTLSEYRNYGTVSQPKKTKNKPKKVTVSQPNKTKNRPKIVTVLQPNRIKNRPKIVNKIDEFGKNAIRLKIHDFWRNREVPIISKILIAINEDPMLPNLNQRSLVKVLKNLKFECLKMRKTRKNVPLEKENLITLRRNYLEKIRFLRAEKRPIYYLDETWINVGETQSRTWVNASETCVDMTMTAGSTREAFVQDQTTGQKDKSSGEAFIEGKTKGQKEPSGKGKRLIVLHIGSTDGFVPGGLLCFESKTNSINYHDDLNSDIFYDWFERILPLLKEKAVIVMDNASYHSVKKFHMPNKFWKKQNIIDWLESKGEIVKHPVLKIDLLKKVRQLKQYDVYAIDEYAKDNEKLVLRIPPYHCGLNSIELAWVSVKNYVKTHNTTYELKDVIKLLKKGLENVTPEMWTNFEEHVIEEEEKLWNIEGIIEEILDGELEERNTSSSDSD